MSNTIRRGLSLQQTNEVGDFIRLHAQSHVENGTTVWSGRDCTREDGTAIRSKRFTFGAIVDDVRLNNLRVVESGTNQYQLQVQPGHNEDWKMCSFPDGFNVSNWIYNQYITTESYNMASAKDRLGRLYHVNVTRETRDVQWNVLRERYLGVLCSCILDYFWP